MKKLASCCPPPGGAYGTARFTLGTGLVFLAALSATLALIRSMAGGMDMPGGWRMSMMWMRMPGQSWAGAAGMFLFMWLSMMVAMMLPALYTKLLHFYRSLVWKRADHPALSTALVTLGYFTVWTGVGGAVYAAGIPFALAAMHWGALSRAVPVLIGLTLVLSGFFQFSPWKREGLEQCRGLLVYAPYGRRQKGIKILKSEGLGESFREGLRQGADCAICCAGSMAVLVALGAMNFYVMLGVAAVIALEKLLPWPKPVVQGVGGLALITGIFLVVKVIVESGP